MSVRFAPAMASPQTEKAPAPRVTARRQHPAPCGNQATLRRLQAKLEIGPVDDPLEHEADAVTDHVMRMPDPALVARASPPRVSCKCAACEEEEKKAQAKPSGALNLVRRKCAACEEEDKKQLRMKPAAADIETGGAAPPIVHDALAGPGRTLDAATLAFFEPRFGHDFSDVRVHADAQSADSARAIGASAYTVGSDVVFAAGRFAPAEPAGQLLLAHELAHVAQQGLGPRRVRRQPPAPEAPKPEASAQPQTPAQSPAAKPSCLSALAAMRLPGVAGNLRGRGCLSCRSHEERDTLEHMYQSGAGFWEPRRHQGEGRFLREDWQLHLAALARGGRGDPRAIAARSIWPDRRRGGGCRDLQGR
jgi:hypothetical protein